MQRSRNLPPGKTNSDKNGDLGATRFRERLRLMLLHVAGDVIVEGFVGGYGKFNSIVRLDKGQNILSESLNAAISVVVVHICQ